MSSITDAEVVTVFDAASLFAFFRWASWAFTRLDCLIDLEGFEDSPLDAVLFMQLHFLPTMSRGRIGLKDSRAYDCSESQAPDEKGSPRHASSSHQNRTIGGDCCSLLRLRLRPYSSFSERGGLTFMVNRLYSIKPKIKSSLYHSSLGPRESGSNETSITSDDTLPSLSMRRTA